MQPKIQFWLINKIKWCTTKRRANLGWGIWQHRQSQTLELTLKEEKNNCYLIPLSSFFLISTNGSNRNKVIAAIVQIKPFYGRSKALWYRNVNVVQMCTKFISCCRVCWLKYLSLNLWKHIIFNKLFSRYMPCTKLDM